MPYIPTWTPADGDTLTAGGINGNDEALESYLSFVPLTDVVSVSQYEIGKRELAKTSSEFGTRTVDFPEDFWHSRKDAFKGVYGASNRVYVKRDLTAAVLNAQVFCTGWRTNAISAAPALMAAPPMFVQIFMDGVGLKHTRRRMPQTVFRRHVATTSGSTYGMLERYVSRAFMLSAPLVDGGSSVKGLQQLTEGWHTFEARLMIEPNESTDTIQWTGSLMPASYMKLVHRIRVGVRNVTLWELP